mgnify:CR=1 FL=1
MIRLYNIGGKYLYEVLEDYKLNQNQEEIFQYFMDKIWHSSNTRQIYTKYIKFTMLPEIVNTEIGQIFYKYVNIPYIASKTMTKNTDYISLIRQKINNIYNNYCEPRLCTRSDYMKLLHIPKIKYYRWEKYNDANDIRNLENVIIQSLDQAQKLKDQYSKQKMKLTWKQFKPFAEEYLRKGFDNYVPLDQYENKTEFILDTDLWTEDNFAIKYLCRCLQLGIKNEQKKYYGLYIKGSKNKIKYRRCVDCGNLIWIKNKDNQTTRCEECQHKRDKERKLKWWHENH